MENQIKLFEIWELHWIILVHMSTFVSKEQFNYFFNCILVNTNMKSTMFTCLELILKTERLFKNFENHEDKIRISN